MRLFPTFSDTLAGNQPLTSHSERRVIAPRPDGLASGFAQFASLPFRTPRSEFRTQPPVRKDPHWLCSLKREPQSDLAIFRPVFAWRKKYIRSQAVPGGPKRTVGGPTAASQHPWTSSIGLGSHSRVKFWFDLVRLGLTSLDFHQAYGCYPANSAWCPTPRAPCLFSIVKEPIFTPERKNSQNPLGPSSRPVTHRHQPALS
jgi:hypothetical protein